MFLKLKQTAILLVLVTLGGSLFLTSCGPENQDLTPPAITLDGGLPRRTQSAGPHLFSGTLEAGATLNIDVSTTATISNLTYGGGLWSFEANDLVEGFNIFEIEATDVNYNTQVLYVTIDLDLVGPVVTLNQFTTVTPYTTQTLAGTVAELDAQDVIVSLDGGSTAFSVDDINGGIWTYSANFVSDGTYEVWVWGIDYLGNEPTDPSELIVKQTIVVDSTAPDFTVTESLPLIITPDPANTTSTELNGTIDAVNYDFTFLTNPVTSIALVDPIPNWKLSIDDIPAGITLGTFAIEDTTPTEVSQANIMIIRDLSGPFLIDNQPDYGETGVSINTKLTLTFSETMDETTVIGDMIVLTDSNGVETPVTVDLPVAPFRTFTFTPDVSLTSSTEYTVLVINPAAGDVTDQYGNSFVPPTLLWTFETL